MKPVVIVTGASKGIGAAIARLFAAEGHDVCAGYLSDEAGAAKTVSDCIASGARAIAVKVNMADRASVANFFRRAELELGRPDCLINNAGIIGATGRLEALPPEALAATFQTNLFGVVYAMQEAITRMSRRHGGKGGAIVNLSSIAATLGSPGEYVHYAASKAAVETLSIGAGKELGADGIRVNAIRVGTTDTDIHERHGNPDRPEKIAALTPLGRIARPGDIAEAALWLTSPRSGFVTGTVLTVAGGFTA